MGADSEKSAKFDCYLNQEHINHPALKGLLLPGKLAIDLILFSISIAAVTLTIVLGTDASISKIAGTLVVASSCYLVLFLFLYQFRIEVLNVLRKTLFMLLIIFIFVLLTRIVSRLDGKDLIFILPFAIIPVVVRTFYDSRLALFILLITLMLSGLIVTDSFGFVLMSFVTGMVAIYTLSSINSRSRLVFTAISVFAAYTILYSGLSLMNKGGLTGFHLSDLLIFSVNSILVLLSYPVILLFEQKFLLISETTLRDLSDITHPLLRKFAEEAPGSYQHSLQVANLAEEAARAIGANLLLVRAGALYHDIGKIANPGYFVENQAYSESPHENLDPKESSKVIINHVKNGVILAKNFKIPVQVIDFIRTHHGTTVAYFFYRKYIDENPGRNEPEKEFTYPGPKPFSKETAIVMMADAAEASSRSLTDYTEESIGELVDRILFTQEQDGQFTDVPLTFREISEIKSVFRKRLLNIYHKRIAYPDRD
jgi:cyclic-di-AMP phosphodiesterase PgpH